MAGHWTPRRQHGFTLSILYCYNWHQLALPSLGAPYMLLSFMVPPNFQLCGLMVQLHFVTLYLNPATLGNPTVSCSVEICNWDLAWTQSLPISDSLWNVCLKLIVCLHHAFCNLLFDNLITPHHPQVVTMFPMHINVWICVSSIVKCDLSHASYCLKLLQEEEYKEV